MAEEVVIKVDVELDGLIAGVRDLKQQFADAEEAVFKLAGAGQQSTQAFADATLEAAKLKQEVDNINSSIDELKPDVKLAAFGRTISGVASGFSAATGAAALLGGESEDLQKTLVKVQAAMAFSMGIRGLADLKQGFKVLALVIKTNPIFLVVIPVSSKSFMNALFCRTISDSLDLDFNFLILKPNIIHTLVTNFSASFIVIILLLLLLIFLYCIRIAQNEA